MSDTPETDAKVSAHIGFYSCATVPAELCRRMERERDEARKKLEDLDVAAIHSCHNECQRPMCVLRRERDELLERNAKLRDIADRALTLIQSQ
jgi:hypothetical protein